MKAGETLDGEGGFTVWDKALALTSADEALPISEAHDLILQRDAASGTI